MLKYSMHFPLISVIGPTSSGKSALSLSLAKKLLHTQKCTGIDIISADSRQVYSNFPLLSGADLDLFADLSDKIKLHGVGIIDFREPWSLGLFYQFATPIIKRALASNRVILIVGGTLLYHAHLFGNNNFISAPPNPTLRTKLETFSLPQLQKLLSARQPHLFSSLNNSDKHNPRRLIRHLEVDQWQKEGEQKKTDTALISAWSTLHKYIAPAFDINSLRPKIKKRVEERFKGGAIDEVAAALTLINSSPHLFSSTPTPLSSPLTLPSLPLGFQEITAFLNHDLNEEQTLDLWSLHEWQYAKRQLTYMNRLGRAQILTVVP